MESTAAIFEKVQDLIAPLNADERLALIRPIAATLSQDHVSHSVSGEQEKLLQMEQEQTAWFALPQSERAFYHGEYVAIYQKQVVDHDPDRRALYIRIRQRYGSTPVPILNAEWENIPTFHIHHVHLEYA